MALQQLNEEQIRTWTRAQKDEWWLKNVYRGNMAQLTFKSALTGFFLGGVLAITALYIGGRTGITLGVGLTSVILAFSIFRVLGRAGIVKDFTILENNCTQSIATAAGYMITPLISSLAAYMLVTGKIVPWWQMIIWNAVISILGVLVAFPLKRRFINEDQAPFPEGRACGVVLDTLYTGKAETGVFQAKLLWLTGAVTALYTAICSDGWMKLIQFKLLRMDKWAGMKEPWYFHDTFDYYYYALGAKMDIWIPKIMGTDIRQLGLRATLDAAMLGVGGLMGIRVAASCAIGAIVNFAVLAPWMIQRGDIREYMSPNGTLVQISRGEIVNQWSLWWGVSMMVVGSLVGLVAKPEIFTSAFKALRRKPAAQKAEPGKDVLAHIELPLWMSYVGVPVFSVIAAWITHEFFGVPWLLSFISLPLIFVLTVICTNSMALTSWTPTGALSKITQFTMGAIDRVNPANNLIPAGMTAEISSNAANLLSDIKPGYMLGGKPRHQAIGHVIGIFAGAIFSTPMFFLLFLPQRDGVRSTDTIVSDAFPMPGALQWKGVADIIANGLSSLPTSAIISVVAVSLKKKVFEVLRIKTKGRFPISAVSLGLGVILPPQYCFTMFAGALIFWWFHRKYEKAPDTKGHSIWVTGCEPICAGLISGAALIGIGNAVVNELMRMAGW